MKTFKLLLIAASAAALFSGCSDMPTIDKEYNALRIDVDGSSLVGEFRQGDEVADAKIILSYENGLGRRAEVFLPEVNGIYSDPVAVTLASRNATDNGSGTVEIILKGVPDTKNRITLRPTIRLETHEVFTTFEVTPTADIVLNAAESTVSGTFKIFEQVQNGKISVSYNSTEPHAVSVAVAEVVGVSGPGFEITLPAAPDGGFFEVPLQGTPGNHGNQNFVVRLVKDGVEYTMTKTIFIEGELAFDLDASSITGDFTAGEPLDSVFITLAYTALREMIVTVNVADVDGIHGEPFVDTLAAGSGTIEIPLTGSPANDDDKTLVITITDENNIVYTAQMSVIIAEGSVFEPEQVTFNGLTYNTVFVDVNGNGFANRGDVWLDRNMGATSADPGTYGAAEANTASFGQLLQWGKPYGVTTYDAAWLIDLDAMGPWTTVCPPGYEVPSLEQWVNAFKKLTGGTISGNNVTNVPGITGILMNSVLKLPLPGWFANDERDHEQAGLQGHYWTSSEGNNESPWKIQIGNNEATATGSNWAGSNWQMPVRCIKSM